MTCSSSLKFVDLGNANQTSPFTTSLPFSCFIDRSEQGEMLAVSATEPPPRAYDTLLPKLFLSSGPTWTKKNTNQGEKQDTTYATQGGEKIWKEEQEEDEDLDRRGQQKGEVPAVELGNEGKHSGDKYLDTDLSTSGSGVVMSQGRNMEDESLASGETEAQSGDQVEENANFAARSSGSGEVQNVREIGIEMTASGDTLRNFENKMGQENVISGGGEQNNVNKQDMASYSPGSGQTRDNVEVFSPEISSSGSGHLEKQETAGDIETGSSGNDQYNDYV